MRGAGRDPVDAQVGVAAAVFARLSARQRLVSVWMTAGFAVADICQHLQMSEREVIAEFDEVARIVRNRQG